MMTRTNLLRTSNAIFTALTLSGILVLANHCAPGSDDPGGDNPAETSGSETGGGAASGGNGAGGSGTGAAATSGSGGSIVADVKTMVHQVSGSLTIEAMDAAVAPDGSLYVAWADQDGQSAQLFVSRSTDDGESFETPVLINTGSIPIQTFSQSAPTISADETRVAVAFTNKVGSNIWFSESNAAGALSFSTPTAVAAGGVSPTNQFPTLAFAADGELFVGWARMETPQGQEPILRVFAARESDGYLPSAVTNESSGRPCSCCSLDMLGLSTGAVLITFRGMDSPRNQFVVSHPGGPGGSWTIKQASNTNWEFVGCPENGPALAEIPGGGARLAWTDPTNGASRVWLVDSPDGGLSWNNERVAYDETQGGQFFSLLAIDPTSGRTWAGWAPPINAQAQVVASDDGVSFDPPVSLHIDEGDFKRPQIVAGIGGSFAFGVVEQQSLWVVSLE